MPKFPEPPDAKALAAIPPEIIVLAVETEVWRVYFRGGGHPTLWSQFRSFGPTNSRFDHQPPPPRVHADRSILYAAQSGVTAIAEVFQAARVIDRHKGDPWLVACRLARDVKLLDLTRAWPTRAGASMNINSGPRPRARKWSLRIYDAYPQIQGLYYASSMYGNAPSLALYERAASAIPLMPTFHRPLSDPGLLVVLKNAALDLGYGLT